MLPMQETCMNSGWLGYLYLNNYQDTFEACVAHGWSLCVDMQLFWISPLILIPLRRNPKLGKGLLSLLICLGITIVFMISYVYHLKMISAFELDRLFMSYEYIPTYARFTPWLIGIGLGYLLYKTKNNPVHMSRGFVISGWILGIGLVLGTWLLGHQFFQPDYQYDRLTMSLCTALGRPVFAVGIAWIIFACARGYGGFVNTFLSCQTFQVMSRLCYSIYLTHMIIVVEYVSSKKTSHYFNDTLMIVEYIGVSALSVCLGLVMWLTVEIPAVNLSRELLDSKPTVDKQRTDLK